MKFERHFDSEVVDFQILSDDYSKCVFLCHDRSVNFHAKFGGYYKTRVPKAGRDLAYHPGTADLLVSGGALNDAEGAASNWFPFVTQSRSWCIHGLQWCRGCL